MENQRVKDVRSLYSILTSVAETYSPIQDMKAISMFPGYSGELASINAVYSDVVKEKKLAPAQRVKKKRSVFQFFHF